MIENLSIKNFKSIKDLSIDCKRINLFIGEPNAGKSNILEALGVISWCSYGGELKKYVRFQGIQNLFFDNLLDKSVEIKIRKMNGKDKISHDSGINISYQDDAFVFKTKKKSPVFKLDYNGNSDKLPDIPEFAYIKFFRYSKMEQFPDIRSSFLMPPQGSNLYSVVMANKILRDSMTGFFKNYGFSLISKPQEKTFDILKQTADMVFSYPYILASDTLQTIIFHVMAIDSNKNSTLIFEEPESHAFPYYTKYLGEMIAFDESNQYFIATHNPYLLKAIIEKTSIDSINVFITYFKDYQTEVKCLSQEEMSELLEYDPFFNLNSFIEEE